jgi:hypothetical protein
VPTDNNSLINVLQHTDPHKVTLLELGLLLTLVVKEIEKGVMYLPTIICSSTCFSILILTKSPSLNLGF